MVRALLKLGAWGAVRLFLALAVYLAGGSLSQSFAADLPIPEEQKKYYATQGTSPNWSWVQAGRFTSWEEACADIPRTGTTGSPAHQKDVMEWYRVLSPGQCRYKKYDNLPNCTYACRYLGETPYNILSANTYTCPAGFVVDTSQAAPKCVCPGASTWDGTQCIKNCLTVGASEAAAYSKTIGTSWLTGPDGQTCGGSGCVWKWAKTFKGYDGQWYGANPYPTGETCGPGGDVSELPVPEDPATDPETPNTCPVGQCPGAINGQSVCVPCAESRETQTKSESTDGTTQTKETVCRNGICTTTEKTNTGTGSTIKTTTESQVDYCARNPLSTHCSGITNNGDGATKGEGGEGTCQGTAEECGEQQSSFGGSCMASFACEGDAVQCAIALDQHKRHCQLYEDENDLSQIGVPAMNGEAQPDGHPGKSGTESSMEFQGLIDQTNLIGGGCPSDVTISPGVVIPFSAVCSQLQVLGQLMVGLSMLAALFIVFRR